MKLNELKNMVDDLYGFAARQGIKPEEINVEIRTSDEHEWHDSNETVKALVIDLMQPNNIRIDMEP